MEIVRHLINVAQGKHPLGTKRSEHWRTVRKQHLEIEPHCALCGGNSKLEVHHIHPFHIHPDLELDPHNLITLCEADKDGVNCHLLFGHLGNFKSWNETVISDTAAWSPKIQNRPTKED